MFIVLNFIDSLIYFSVALIADGVHMFTHTLAFFISGAAYTLAKRLLDDKRYVFGTAKMGDLGAYTSAIILIGVSLYIVYDSINLIVNPVDLVWLDALPVACGGLFVNILSGFLLGGCFECGEEGDHHDDPHGGHGHSHGHVQEVLPTTCLLSLPLVTFSLCICLRFTTMTTLSRPR